MNKFFVRLPVTLFLSAIAVLAIFIGLSLTVSAEPIPEKDIVGDTVYIEPDDNIIRQNIIDGDPDVSREPETDRVISLDRKTYFDRFILPFVLIMICAVTLFGIGVCMRKN